MLKTWLLRVLILAVLLRPELSSAWPALAPATVLQVTSTGDSGAGTLRQALFNAQVGDTIVFSPSVFPPSAPAIIRVRSALPSLNKNGLTLDASNAGVILDGSQAPAGTNGLIISADGCTVWGLTIQNFSSNGVILEPGASGNHIGGDRGQGSGPHGRGNRLSSNGGNGVELRGAGTDGNWVQGSWIGVDSSGWNPAANTYNGVAVWQGARNNLIGGSLPGERNLVSGNQQNGIWIGGTGTGGNILSGNWIGVRVDGEGPLPNRFSGISLQDGTQDNRIGGTLPGEGNLISGNTDHGVYMSDAGTRLNRLLGNWIGPGKTGAQAIGQGMHGVVLTRGASDNAIGDGTPAGRNLLSGNGLSGVLIEGEDTQGNTVYGNYMGTNLSGTAALPNGMHGVELARGAHDNRIGGAQPGQGNLLSGNRNHGLVINTGAHHNIAAGNIVGPDATGTYPIGNHPWGGIDIADGAHDNLIGGTEPGGGNLISGNPTDGIALFNSISGGPATANNQVIGNFIGTTLGGGSPLPNDGDGVFNVSGAYGTLVQGNTIAYNAKQGVWSVECGSTITQNSIYANSGGGILNSCASAPPAPQLTATSTTSLKGKTIPGARVEIFSDDLGQGRAYEGFATAGGSGDFTFTKAAGFSGPNVTASVASPAGESSAFSPPVRLLWTVLLYLDGDNDLDEAMFDMVQNLVAAGPSPRANVLALVDGAQSTVPSSSAHPETRLYNLTLGRNEISATLGITRTVPGELDMGEGGALADFVNWGRAYAPSRYTLLAIVDHGGGWAPSPAAVFTDTLPIRRPNYMAGGSGLSWDFTNGYDYLDSPELRTALGLATGQGADPLDVVFYDVCLMGMLEVAYQIQGYTDFFVSSQNIGWAPIGPQGRYVQAVSGIAPDTTPQKMAELLVKSYNDSLPPYEHPFTASALDMSRLPALVTAVDALGQALTGRLTSPAEASTLHSAYLETQKIDYDSDFAIEPATDGFVDLYDFARRVTENYTDPTVDAAAAQVMEHLTGPSGTVIAEAHRSGNPWVAPAQVWDLADIHGLSIFLPLGEDLELVVPASLQEAPGESNERLVRLRETYTAGQLRFLNATSWRGLIDRYYQVATVPPGETDGPAGGLLPPDISPPDTTIQVTAPALIGGTVYITYTTADRQTGVTGIELWARSPGGGWQPKMVVDHHPPVAATEGTFELTGPVACGTRYTVVAVDGAGNRGPIDGAGNSAELSPPCIAFLPLLGR